MDSKPQFDSSMAKGWYEGVSEWSGSNQQSADYYQVPTPGGYRQNYQPHPQSFFSQQQMTQTCAPNALYDYGLRQSSQMQQPYLFDSRSSSSSALPPLYSPQDPHRNYTPSAQPDTYNTNNLRSSPSQTYIQFSPSQSPRHLSPSPSQTKLIAIPAKTTKSTSSFLRSYPPSLATHHISPTTFLTFLDRLNHVKKDSPPLQVLGVAGQIVGFMPFASAQLVSLGIGAASKLGNVAMTKGRTEMFLSESNKQLFEPRGLRVEICKVEAMAKMGGVPILDGTGNIDPKAPLWGDLRQARDPLVKLDVLRPWVQELEMYPKESPEQSNSEDTSSNVNNGTNGASSSGSGSGAGGTIATLKKLGKFAKERKQKRDGSRASQDQNRAEGDYRRAMAELDGRECEINSRESGRRRVDELRRVQDDRRRAEERYQRDSGNGKGKDAGNEAGLWLVIREVKPMSQSGQLQSQQ